MGNKSSKQNNNKSASFVCHYSKEDIEQCNDINKLRQIIYEQHEKETTFNALLLNKNRQITELEKQLKAATKTAIVERLNNIEIENVKQLKLDSAIFRYNHHHRDWNSQNTNINICNSSRWATIIDKQFNSKPDLFLNFVFEVVFNCLANYKFDDNNTNNNLSRDLFHQIVGYCEDLTDIGNLRLYAKYARSQNPNPKPNPIITHLYCTSRARDDCEFPSQVLNSSTNGHHKWYTNRHDSPMLLFKFDLPVLITRYALQTANDCPHRDPFHFYLFGVNHNQIQMSGEESDWVTDKECQFLDQVSILHEYNGHLASDRRRSRPKPWLSQQRWSEEYFDVNQQIVQQQIKFEYIGLCIVSGNRNNRDIQIGKIAFDCYI